MRTSRISQETTRVFNALSPNTRRTRTTRSAANGIATFALGYDGSIEVKDEQLINDRASTTPEIEDIEDIARSSVPSRKRKYGTDSPTTTVATTLTAVEYKSKRTTPRKKQVKNEDSDSDKEDGQEQRDSSPQGRAKAKPKIPARRTTLPDGTVQVQPPSNWGEIYDIIQQMRDRNPTAPVDTMGCEDLFWPTAPPKQKRYHTLTALMLSSQTKDTVTAAAMQRLHTELVPQQQTAAAPSSSLLTVDNILACDPVHLDHLIGKVGFHNNKTKFIKAAAAILRDEYAGDIPNTIEGLVRLPGVGPKMAYLCMSAAWGVDEGIGVDVHVHRITNLWGWHKTKAPEETRAWLESWLPRDKWHHINKMLVGLGQTVCLPVAKRCGECDLAGTGLCKAEIRGWKATERRVKKEKIEVGKDDEGQKVSVRVETKHKDVNIKEELVEG